METNIFYTGKAEEVLLNFDDNTIDLVVTSPPYDLIRTYNNKVSNKLVFPGGYSFPFEKIAKQLVRVVKKSGVIVWVVGDSVIKKSETGSSFKQALYFIILGMKLHDTMIYEKNGPSFPASRSGNRYSQIFEYMFVFSKNGPPKTAKLICDKSNRWAGYTTFGKASYRNKDGELIERKIKPIPEFSPRYNIWRYNTGKGYSTKDDIAFNVPAIFPEKLAEDHILTWSNEGDIVLDPFSGSGTTAKMALLNNRSFIGIDINDDYNQIARKRIENLDKK